MLCPNFGWKCSWGSGGEDILNLVNVFSLFCYNLPLEILHLDKIESPSPKDVMCQVCLEWPCDSREKGNIRNYQAA